MDNTTIVLPSARAIRHEQLTLSQSSLFLPNYITMNEFISKLTVVAGYKFIDDDTRVLLLLEASDFKGFDSLKIERNFFTFMKNSSYIFKFFGELSAEKYDINLLSSADIYAEYEEHISILIELRKQYEKLCKERKYLDPIFLPELYTFNESYASSHTEVSIKIDGYLTNFELELLEKCCLFTKIRLIFTTSKFNTKMQAKFTSLGIELQSDYVYQISLNDKKVIDENVVSKNRKVTCESFSESLLQVAFVKQKIYEFIKKGYEPQNIAVIVPNEKMATLLKSFDTKANLNLAMGESFMQSQLYIKLQATIKAIDLDSKENYARVQRVGDELYVLLLDAYRKLGKDIDFIAFLEQIKEFFKLKQELKIFEEELYSFKKLLPFMNEMNLKSLLNLFMQRLGSRTLDDVRGGKVTVMGVLETRSVAFDGVIIIDFDDKNVPKRSDKDMFLNSALREVASLPTMSDRENLQKHYYNMLINSSKDVAISYVSSSESSGSRFLKQLGITTDNIHDELEYSSLLFTKDPKSKVHFEDVSVAYSFKDIKLSATRLKTFLTCKRKYYFKYIQHIKNHIIPTDMPQEYEIGNAVHLALKELYSKRNSYENSQELQRDLDRELERVCGESELESYLIEIQKRKLVDFSVAEVERFAQGWSVTSVEEYYEAPYCGITLEGRIDRIDKRGTDIEVLDYKTGNYQLYTKNSFSEATDFQLEFYHLLAASLGSVVACGFYDLKESKIVPEAFLSEKLEILKSHIKDLLAIEEIDTKMCEDEKNCTYCDYRVMCLRD